MKKDYVFKVLKSSENEEFYWHLLAGNYEKVAWSGETYSNLGGCLNGLYKFRQGASEAPVNDLTTGNAQNKIANYEFELYEDQVGEFRWRFQAPNNQIIAVSGEGYTRKRSALETIALIKEHCKASEVVVDIDEPVDIESCAKDGHPVPKARHYVIRIDKQKFKLDDPKMTGRELLTLAEKTPLERFRIDQKLKSGQTKRVALDETVDLCEPGVERFMTMPLDQREGSPSRRAFRLPEEDEDYLESTAQKWETITQPNQQWLLIYDYKLPNGYTASSTNLALLISPHYPVAQIDMCYFKY